MAAPTAGRWGTTAVVAYATGADANPVRDGWTTNVTQSGHADLQRVSNFLEDNGAGSLNCQVYRPGAVYPVSPYGYEFWAEIHTLGTNGQDIDFSVNIADVFPLVSQYDLYQGVITLSAGVDTWDIFRIANASAGVIGTSGTTNIAAGDYWDISVRRQGTGNRIELWYWDSAAAVGTWAGPKATALDATPLADGMMGIEFTRVSNWSWGNIYGGIIPASPPFVPLGRGASW